MSKQKYFHVSNIRELAYFTNKKSILFLAAIVIFFIKRVVSVLFQYLERRPIHYHNYVETWVSNIKFIKFIKDYDIGPEMT